jgi:predicted nucleic acid-binding protein
VAVALLDSPAVVAYLVEGDALHGSAADAIESTMRSGTSLAISAVTWSETLHGALLGHFPEEHLREFVEDFGIAILGVDVEVAEQAAALQKAYRRTGRLRTPDALILGTSLAYGDVEKVICGDEQWAKVPGVRAEVVRLG